MAIAFAAHVSKDRPVALQSRSHRDIREAIERLATRGLPPVRLAERVMSAVRTVVGCDGYRVFALDPQTNLVNRLLAASDNDDDARIEWLRDIYLATGPMFYVEHSFLIRHHISTVAVNPDQSQCWGYPRQVFANTSAREHLRLFHELRSPESGVLLLHLRSQGQWFAVIQMYRRDRGHPFTREEVMLIERLQRPISNALAASLSRERALQDTNTLGSSGVLILDANYHLRLVTPSAERWFTALHDADGRRPTQLPTAVWSALAALRAHDGTAAGHVSANIGSQHVQVEASSGGPDGSIALVISPRLPPQPPDIPTTWDLSQQERRVVIHLLRGYSNRQISETLFISENTIEWHLRHIYEKLGVRSRSQLLARYVRESWGAAMTSSDEVE